jgi:hypothetical protein
VDGRKFQLRTEIIRSVSVGISNSKLSPNVVLRQTVSQKLSSLVHKIMGLDKLVIFCDDLRSLFFQYHHNKY